MQQALIFNYSGSNLQYSRWLAEGWDEQMFAYIAVIVDSTVSCDLGVNTHPVNTVMKLEIAQIVLKETIFRF
jgi:hypothetical protein